MIAAGAPVYHAGNYMCWGDADAVSLGTFYLVHSVGWGGGGGEGLGDLGVNALLAPIQMKMIIGENGTNLTTIPNPFSPLGKCGINTVGMRQLSLTETLSLGCQAAAAMLECQLSSSQSRSVKQHHHPCIHLIRHRVSTAKALTKVSEAASVRYPRVRGLYNLAGIPVTAFWCARFWWSVAVQACQAVS